jgi:hypothetical protein
VDRARVERVLAAALVLAGAGLPVAALVRRHRDTDRRWIDAPALRAVRGDPSLAPPVAVLYVSRRCGHCAAAAARFDSITARRAVRAVIVTGEPAESAGALIGWAAALRLRHAALALDTGRHLGRAVALRAVPASISITGAAGRARYDDAVR